MNLHRSRRHPVVELPLVGAVEDCEKDILSALLELAPGQECVLYIDCSGGSTYSSMAITTTILHRRINATGIVVGECSSSALLILAACRKRLAAPYATFFFHPMKWESGEGVDAREAASWGKYFSRLEGEFDQLQKRLFGNGSEQFSQFINEFRFLTGREMAETGLVELLPLEEIPSG
ncbi:ATP-dependent Clp protease proteolytic subunit [bacterium]|nr:ATP-dependent Clp protease proteolytic subunit [bacterium]